MEEENRGVEWMPGFATAVLTLIVTRLIPLVGTVAAAAALGVLVLHLVRRQWTVLSWICLGAVVGAGIIWLLFGAHAVL